MAQYSHRNGESEPPTEPGWAWYWYRGQIVKPGQKRGSRHFVMLQCYPVSQFDYPPRVKVNGKMLPLESCQGGQWWGPVTPPWEQDNATG